MDKLKNPDLSVCHVKLKMWKISIWLWIMFSKLTLNERLINGVET